MDTSSYFVKETSHDEGSQTGFSPPLWLTELAKSHLPRTLPCFSKAETISIFQVVCVVQVYRVNSPEFYLLPKPEDVLWVRNGRQQFISTLGCEEIRITVQVHKGTSQHVKAISHGRCGQWCHQCWHQRWHPCCPRSFLACEVVLLLD